jgi:hypothetical protein
MERKPYYEKGDIVSTLNKKEIKLILSVTDDEQYEVMDLKDWYFDDIFGKRYYTKKGDISKQFIDVIEKNTCIYRLE